MSVSQSVTALEAEIEELERANGVIRQPEVVQELEEEEEEDQPKGRVREEEPDDPEEASFKKRYADLRRHSQREREELKEQVEELKAQISELRSSTSMPDSLEEARDWAEKNPKAAEIIRALAKEQVKSVAPTEDVKKVKSELDRIKAEAQIRKAHDDFDDIVSDDAFHDWAESQPKRIQDMVYGKDSEDVIWAISQFKAFSKRRPDPNKEAAKTVRKTKTSEVPGNGPRAFSESQVNRMSAAEYEANLEAIEESLRGGTFVYDLSAGAR